MFGFVRGRVGRVIRLSAPWTFPTRSVRAPVVSYRVHLSRRAQRTEKVPTRSPKTLPILALILGDQLDRNSAALAAIDSTRDTVMMVEALEESTHVPSHRQRTILFLSAMRHHAKWLADEGFSVDYVMVDDPAHTGTIAGAVKAKITSGEFSKVVVVQPGEHRLARTLAEAAAAVKVPLEFLEDTHFLTSKAQFASWASPRKQLTMEYFYREQRKRLGVLVDDDGKPLGGDWNYDSDNRQAFPKSGPAPRPKPALRFKPDAITRKVQALVDTLLPSAPGRGESFAWPVTREDATAALKDFIAHRLDTFGPFEDAMWTDEPHIYHSLLSPMLNLKLLNPRECVEAAVKAHTLGKARLQSVEAFVRQIIGWREYIRGVYYFEGETYGERNFLDQHGDLPEFYWTGQTDLACMRECLGQVVDYGYNHHIQRLMVTGNFALISGVHPRAVSDWYLSMYVDAVDWVTLPNTLGMVMHADGTAEKGPVVGTKPYCASGQYIKRMSNYCTKCKYDPALRHGPTACPFTVFYWDFLVRHRARFEKNPRMATILKNLDRFGPEQVQQITISASSLREKHGIGNISKPRRGPVTRDYTGRNYAPLPRTTTGLF